MGNQAWRQNNLNFVGKQEGTLVCGGHQQRFPPLYERVNKLEEIVQLFIPQSLHNQNKTNASSKNLEVQVGQLTKSM